MAQTYRILLGIATLPTILVLSTSSCQKQSQLEINTATPTFGVRTPEPTATPLFRANRVSGYYGQTLILHIGDTFILDDLLEDAIEPISFDRNILQLISDPTGKITGPKMFRAVKPGITEINTMIQSPCPLEPMPVGCAPPSNETLVVVHVYDPNQPTITPTFYVETAPTPYPLPPTVTVYP